MANHNDIRPNSPMDVDNNPPKVNISKNDKWSELYKKKLHIHTSHNTIISKGTKIIVSNNHKQLGGKEYIVEGTIKEVMGIDDLWTDLSSLSNMAIMNYRRNKETAPYAGVVYYGKIGSLGYCIHESFLNS
jgi:hypothetical protein